MLVLGLARKDGSILAADAFAVADACGRSPEQVRSCLRRLVAECCGPEARPLTCVRLLARADEVDGRTEEAS